MPKLIVVGAGGCGREVMQWAIDWGTLFTPYGFIDDNPNALSGLFANHPILGSISRWQPAEDELFVCGIADPKTKRKVVADLKARGARFISLVHPTALVSATAQIGEGVVICPHATISDNAKVNDYVYINLYTAIGHDAIVGAYSTLSSFTDITGGVVIGEEVFSGSHVSVVPKVQIGAGAYLCAGSVVMSRVAKDTKVLGNPARRFAL